MHAVVTGCAGFIGSHLSERLLADGWHVTGIDSFTDYYDPAEKRRNLDGLRSEPRFELIEDDVATAPLDRLLRQRPAVFHIAAQAGVRGSFGEEFTRYLHDNVRSTQRVFEAAVEAGVRRVVYASSSSVYGNAEVYPCGEATPLSPRSPYGVTKATCEDLARIARHGGLETVGLRYFTVYGPRQRPDMAMRRLCETAIGGPSFELYGDGEQSRDFTFVADAVDATVRSMTTENVDPILNIGGGQEASMNQVISIIQRLAGRRLLVERMSTQRGDVQRTCADTTVARRQLGWRPSTSLHEGLAAELEFVSERRAAMASSGAVLAAVGSA